MWCNWNYSATEGRILRSNETLKLADMFCWLVWKVTSNGQTREDRKCKLTIVKKMYVKKKKVLTLNINANEEQQFESTKTVLWSDSITTYLNLERVCWKLWCSKSLFCRVAPEYIRQQSQWPNDKFRGRYHYGLTSSNNATMDTRNQFLLGYLFELYSSVVLMSPPVTMWHQCQLDSSLLSCG